MCYFNRPHHKTDPCPASVVLHWPPPRGLRHKNISVSVFRLPNRQQVRWYIVYEWILIFILGYPLAYLFSYSTVYFFFRVRHPLVSRITRTFSSAPHLVLHSKVILVHDDILYCFCALDGGSTA